MKAQPHFGKIAFMIAVIIILLIAPLFIQSKYVIHVLFLMFLYSIYASSWNILVYSGQFSLGHSAFLGLGGYASVLLAKTTGWHPVVTIFIGTAIAVAFGFVIGAACTKLREWYLALVTAAAPFILEGVVRGSPWAGGAYGVVAPALLQSVTEYYYLMFAYLIVTLVLVRLIMRSKLGLAFSAIRENEFEARQMGIDVPRIKLLAFLISTFFAGLLGAIYAHYMLYISYEIFIFDNSVYPILMSVLGGMGTLWGPVLGAVILTFFLEYLRALPIPVLRILFIGIIMLVVIRVLPKGIIPTISESRLIQRLRLKTPSTTQL